MRSDLDGSGLRLAIVRARYQPTGGAEHFVNLALGTLISAGLKVTVLARRWDGVQRSANFTWARCDPFYLGATWRDAGFARAVRQCLRQSDFDLVQSHERIAGVEVYRAGDGVHAVWLEKRRSVQSPWSRLGVFLSAHHRYLCRVEKAMFEHPRLRAVICNSVMVRDEIRARFAIDANKLHVIYNGVDLKRFQPRHGEALRRHLRARLAIAEDARVWLFVGSGFARKGLLAALVALARAGGTSMLVVVGDDRHKRRYEAKARALGIASRCRFVGVQSDVVPYYAMADAFILPTLYDPFPNAVLEALASGLPVLTTSACGAREVIVEGANGWLCEPLDEEPMASHISRFADLDARARDAMRAAARKTAEEFDLGVMGERLLALYRQLLPGH